MKYKYPKRKKFFNLAIGLLWICFGLSGISDESTSYEYIALSIGIIYFGLALYMQVASYVTVTAIEIIKNNMVPIHILFSEIVTIKEFSGKVTISGNDKKITIHKSNIQKDQIPQFEAFLETIKPE